MADKVFIPDPSRFVRVWSHGQITDLSTAFSVPGNLPFTVWAQPKDDTVTSVMINCKCYQDEVASPAPVACGDWSPLAIVEIEAGAVDLTAVDLYWGCGYNVEG